MLLKSLTAMQNLQQIVTLTLVKFIKKTPTLENAM